MSEENLKLLSDRLSDAHRLIQEKYADINPVIGVNRQMRAAGIPADLFTIDCLKTNRRLLLVLHDGQPDLLQYQYGHRDQDPGDTFESQPVAGVTVEVLMDWIVSYFTD